MNFVSILLISTYSVSILLSVVLADEVEDIKIQFVEECNTEENLNIITYTLEDVRAIVIPIDHQEGCVLDCFFLKTGQILSSRSRVGFVRLAPRRRLDNSVYGPLFDNQVLSTQQTQAVSRCLRFLSSLQVEQCTLMYKLRYCLFLEMNPSDVSSEIDY
ncbi:uncharacterized protein LOC135833265 isoform X1 [Planococcus citri]|uniref:uncharacterized protein LOC135833265 isoform X1 n=1 Tax=Planococcus citri TaxID=170843 RepID=UPI0031F89CE0